MVFLVYDVTNKDSLENLNDWLRMVRKYALRGKVMLIANKVTSLSCKLISSFLIAYKVDLIGQRQVTEEEHFQFVRENDIPLDMFVSAKSGENVLKAFYKVSPRKTYLYFIVPLGGC